MFRDFPKKAAFIIGLVLFSAILARLARSERRTCTQAQDLAGLSLTSPRSLEAVDPPILHHGRIGHEEVWEKRR
jgi:hypothetical protein